MRLGVVGTMEEGSEVPATSILSEMFYNKTGNIVVVSGGTKGVDTAARGFAKDKGFSFILLKPSFMLDPDRERNDKDFWIRDKQIVDNSDVVVIIGPEKDKRCNRIQKHAHKRKKEVIRRYL